jgi:glycosyltransferase involved in cell wall biosynthesis
MEVKQFPPLAQERTIELSIITATLPGRQGASLSRAYDSIIRQSREARFEWLIQVDGGKREENAVKNELQHLEDPRIRIVSNGKHLGVSTTRNIALERALGGVICYLDDDDFLTTEAFATWLGPLSEDSNLIWAGGQMIYNFPEQGLVQFESLLPAGNIKPRQFFDAWKGPNLRFPHPPSTIAARIEAVRALGGWPALPQGDDLGLILALSDTGHGYLSTENVYVYCQHAENTMTSEGFENLESASRNIIWNRSASLGKQFSACNPV